MEKKVEELFYKILDDYAKVKGKESIERLKDSFFTLKHGWRGKSSNSGRIITRSGYGETPALDTTRMYKSNYFKTNKIDNGVALTIGNSAPYAHWFDGQEHRIYWFKLNKEYNFVPRQYLQPVIQQIQKEIKQELTEDAIANIIIKNLLD